MLGFAIKISVKLCVINIIYLGSSAMMHNFPYVAGLRLYSVLFFFELNPT